MVVMRGVPGAGKSTIVNYLANKLDTNCICSADLFFMKNGRYEYDRSKIGQAHEFCHQKGTSC